MKLCLLLLFTVEKRPTPIASRAGATPETFWAACRKKAGSLPPDLAFFPTVTFALLDFVFLCWNKISGLSRVKICRV
jgi:hypothetical protein